MSVKTKIRNQHPPHNSFTPLLTLPSIYPPGQFTEPPVPAANAAQLRRLHGRRPHVRSSGDAVRGDPADRARSQPRQDSRHLEQPGEATPAE